MERDTLVAIMNDAGLNEKDGAFAVGEGQRLVFYLDAAGAGAVIQDVTEVRVAEAHVRLARARDKGTAFVGIESVIGLTLAGGETTSGKTRRAGF